MLENKFRNQNKQFLVFNNLSKSGLYDEDSDGSDKKDGNRKRSALTRQGKSTCSKKA